MTIRRTIRLDDELDQRLTDYTESSEMRPSDVIRDALKEYLDTRTNKRESLADRLRRTGHVGKYKLGAPDVATNPKYMEGFGE